MKTSHKAIKPRRKPKTMTPFQAMDAVNAALVFKHMRSANGLSRLRRACGVLGFGDELAKYAEHLADYRETSTSDVRPEFKD